MSDIVPIRWQDAEEIKAIAKSISPMPQKYLFRAVFKDNSIYDQTMEDVSLTEPDKRSAFYDVAQRLSEVQIFGIYGPVPEVEGVPMHTYVVDLNNGEFMVDGVPFRMHEEGEIDGPLTLIYFRRHKETNFPRTHTRVYRLGWSAPCKFFKTLPNGKIITRRRMIERVMEID